MFIIAYIIEGIATVLGLALGIYYYLLLARVLMSWVNPDPYNKIVVFLRQMTDPILEPLRQIFMPLTIRIRVDLSPILAFFIIVFLQKSLVGMLFHIAYMLK